MRKPLSIPFKILHHFISIMGLAALGIGAVAVVVPVALATLAGLAWIGVGGIVLLAMLALLVVVCQALKAVAKAIDPEYGEAKTLLDKAINKTTKKTHDLSAIQDSIDA